MLFGLIKTKTDAENLQLQEILTRTNLMSRLTPDLSELQSKFGHNVFVYNRTKSEYPDHSVFKTPKFYRGFGYTSSRDFVMYKKNLGLESYPIVMEIGEDQKMGTDDSLIGEPGQIIGELFTTRWESIVELDQYHLNMVQFRRIRVDVTIPFQIRDDGVWQHRTTHAWMYVGNPDFWNPQLFSSEAKKLFTPVKRIIAKKNYESEELGANYTFDYKIEAHPS